MSRILEQLKLAEQQRQHIVAERRRLEAEANAALAAHDREERTEPAPVPARQGRAAQPVRPDRRALAGVAIAIALALVAGFWSAVHSPEKVPIRDPGAASVVTPNTEAQSRDRPFQLKLDQDVNAFAARVREKERQ